jgi:hypothetical protein
MAMGVPARRANAKLCECDAWCLLAQGSRCWLGVEGAVRGPWNVPALADLIFLLSSVSAQKKKKKVLSPLGSRSESCTLRWLRAQVSGRRSKAAYVSPYTVYSGVSHVDPLFHSFILKREKHAVFVSPTYTVHCLVGLHVLQGVCSGTEPEIVHLGLFLVQFFTK